MQMSAVLNVIESENANNVWMWLDRDSSTTEKEDEPRCKQLWNLQPSVWVWDLKHDVE